MIYFILKPLQNLNPQIYIKPKKKTNKKKKQKQKQKQKQTNK